MAADGIVLNLSNGALLTRAKHRKASELPKPTRSSTDSEKTEPNRPNPKRDALLPSRMKFLKLKLLPRCRQSRTLTVLLP